MLWPFPSEIDCMLSLSMIIERPVLQELNAQEKEGWSQRSWNCSDSEKDSNSNKKLLQYSRLEIGEN